MSIDSKNTQPFLVQLTHTMVNSHLPTKSKPYNGLLLITPTLKKDKQKQN
jgi:hypothetical protein